MSYVMKRYENLDITDNFMFSKVFSNEDVAKDFLQDVLKISIEKISVVGEATTQEDPFHKSVRFDVMVKEEVPEASGKPGVDRMFDLDILAKAFRDAGVSLEIIAKQTGLSPEEIKAM